MSTTLDPTPGDRDHPLDKDNCFADIWCAGEYSVHYTVYVRRNMLLHVKQSEPSLFRA